MALNITATPASKSEVKAPLPEPEVSFEVDSEGQKVTATVVFDLNLEDNQPYKSKKSLVLGETGKPVPVSFDVNGEQMTLSMDGNSFVFGARLSVRQEDKKTEETAATVADEEGAAPDTE
jgi:hypothetical protein